MSQLKLCGVRRGCCWMLPLMVFFSISGQSGHIFPYHAIPGSHQLPQYCSSLTGFEAALHFKSATILPNFARQLLVTASPNFKALTTSLVWSHQSTKRLSIVQQVKPSPREDQVPPDCLHPGVRAGSFGNSPWSTIEHVAMLPCPCSTLLLL